jgi:tRNA/rRNA methyltransferase
MKTEIIPVLVEPLYDRNIGSISRVMSNFGLTRLILINRQCSITYEAQLAAATGQNALQQRIEYSSWNEFLAQEKEGALLAFSARDGRGRQTEELRFVTQRFLAVPELTRLYLVFGREDRGLSAADLEHCHFCAKLPVPGPNFSLNLSHAALLAIYLVWQELCLRDQRDPDLAEDWSDLVSDSKQEFNLIDKKCDEIEGPLLRQKKLDEQLLKFLHSLGMNFENRRINAYTIILKLLKRAYPSRKESVLLQNIFAQAARLISKKK